MINTRTDRSFEEMKRKKNESMNERDNKPYERLKRNKN